MLKDLENVVSRHQTLYSWQPAGAKLEYYILDDIEDRLSLNIMFLYYYSEIKDLELVMPYFVYKIAPGITKIVKNLEQMDDFEKFKDAKNYAKEQRQLDAESGNTYKVIFAENNIEAEEKLQEQREETILREWEK